MSIRSQRPTCARCGHAVEAILLWDHPDPAQVLLVIRCHGEAEQLALPMWFARASTTMLEIAVTVAFRERQADIDAQRWEDLPADEVVR